VGTARRQVRAIEGSTVRRLALASILLLVACQRVNNGSGPFFGFVVRNNSGGTIANITLASLGASQVVGSLDPGTSAVLDLFRSVDPSWYFSIEFRTTGGALHKKRFFHVIPNRLWKECASGDRQLVFTITNTYDVVAEISDNQLDAEKKIIREHPERFREKDSTR